MSIIRSWYQREGYVNSMADLIQKELEKFQKPEEVSFIVVAYTFCMVPLQKFGMSD